MERNAGDEIPIVYLCFYDIDITHTNNGNVKASLQNIPLKSTEAMGSMHGVISGEGLRMLDNFRRS